MATAIKKKPTASPTVTVKRDGNKYTAEWKFSSSATSSSSDHRVTDVAVSCRVDRKKYSAGDGAHGTILYQSGGHAVNGSRSTYDGSSSSGATNKFIRKNWYPYKGDVQYGIGFEIAGYNSKGMGPSVLKYFKWDAPASVPVTTTKNINGTITVKMTASAAEGNAERAYTDLYYTRESTVPGDTTSKTVKVGRYFEGKPAKADKTITIDEPKYGAIPAGKQVKYTFWTQTYGMAGMTKSTTKTVAFSLAGDSVITNVSMDRSYIYITASHTGKVASAQVQVGYSEIENADYVTSWSDVKDAVNNGTFVGFTVSRGLINPSVGEFTFFRIKCMYEGENTANYSNGYCVRELYVPLVDRSEIATDIHVTSVESIDDDPEALMAYVSWTSGPNYNCTQVSWSDDAEAWRSTKEPTVFSMPDATWMDDGDTTSGATHVKIRDLEESTQYYVRARRYNTANDMYSAWSEVVSGVTGLGAAGVTLAAPDVAEVGKPIGISWIIGAGKPQQSWAVLVNGQEVANGTGSAMAYSIQPDALAGLTEAVVSVRVGTGGNNFYEPENPPTVLIRQRPTASVSSSRTISSLPHSFTVTGTSGAYLRCRLVACGVTAQLPDGTDEQWDGDEVWAAGYTIEDAPVTGYIEPMALARLYDGAEYRLEVTPTAYGLIGSTATPSWSFVDDDGEPSETDRMTVAWAHQAPVPDASVTVDAEALAATITPSAAGMAATDVFDVYRETPNGTYLLEAGVAPGASVTDEYAPYSADGEAAYRIATRTADGDMDWADVPYVLMHDSLRLDWPGGFVELPYDLSIAHQVAKGYEGVTYLDGTHGGSWDGSAVLTASIGASRVKAATADEEKSLADLAAYDGAVMVRDPKGHAYMANVRLDNITWTSSSGIASCSITAEEVR